MAFGRFIVLHWLRGVNPVHCPLWTLPRGPLTGNTAPGAWSCDYRCGERISPAFQIYFRCCLVYVRNRKSGNLFKISVSCWCQWGSIENAISDVFWESSLEILPPLLFRKDDSNYNINVLYQTQTFLKHSSKTKLSTLCMSCHFMLSFTVYKNWIFCSILRIRGEALVRTQKVSSFWKSNIWGIRFPLLWVHLAKNPLGAVGIKS